jgi:hypothetical protein
VKQYSKEHMKKMAQAQAKQAKKLALERLERSVPVYILNAKQAAEAWPEVSRLLKENQGLVTYAHLDSMKLPQAMATLNGLLHWQMLQIAPGRTGWFIRGEREYKSLQAEGAKIKRQQINHGWRVKKRPDLTDVLE